MIDINRDKPITLVELIEMRVADPAGPLQDKTVEHYHRTIRQLSEWLGRPATTDDLNSDTLMGWARAMEAEERLRPATINSRLKQPKALWDWAARRRLVDDLPPKRLGIKEPDLMPSSWNGEELKAIFSACGRQTGWVGPHKAADFWLGLHWWLYNTGERYGATMLLEPSMVDLDAKVARVPARIRKGDIRTMVYHLSPKGVDAIGRVLERSEQTVFTHGWANPQGLYKPYRSILEDSGVRWIKRTCGPQKMRRTVATAIKHRGGDPRIFLGHKIQTVADESYIDRELLMAHSKGIWPADDLDPFTVEEPGLLAKLFGKKGGRQ